MLIQGEYSHLNNNSCAILNCNNDLDILCHDCDSFYSFTIAIFCVSHSLSCHKDFNQLHIWSKIKKNKNGILKIDYKYVWEPRQIQFKNCIYGTNEFEEFYLKIVSLKGHLETKIKRILCPCHDKFKHLLENKLFPSTPTEISILFFI